MLLAAAGCKEEVTTLDDVAAVRAVHSSPDLPAVDVYIEGITIPLAVDLEYGDASDFGLLPAVKGAIFEVRPTGADPRSEPLFMSEGFTLAPSEISTAALGGLAESDDPVDSLRVVLDPENFDLVTGGTWRIRFSNMVSDVPQISIDIGSDGIVDDTVDRFRPTDVAGIPLSSDSTTFLTIVVPSPGACRRSRKAPRCSSTSRASPPSRTPIRDAFSCCSWTRTARPCWCRWTRPAAPRLCVAPGGP
jgi:hypothetical protein